jgi:DNA polymerase/3'-5' exonuclease PolX
MLVQLEGIGQKWTNRIFEIEDIGKIEKAQEEIMDGTHDVKVITAVLDAFPEDFTQLCEIEDIDRGMKRKVEWVEDLETPKMTRKTRKKAESVGTPEAMKKASSDTGRKMRKRHTV